MGLETVCLGLGVCSEFLTNMAKYHPKRSALIRLAGHNLAPVARIVEQHDDIPQEQGTWFMCLMLGAATKAERRGLLYEWQAGMPPEVFVGVIVNWEWAEGDWAVFDRA